MVKAMIQFKDRTDAGQQLAKKLSAYKNDPDAIVIGLPRGGVVTAFAIAEALNVPLDIVVARKIGMPFNPELAAGALTEDGTVLLNKEIMEMSSVTRNDLDPIIKAEKDEAIRRLTLYRQGKLPLNLTGKKVILVDDGIATGATMRAAIASVRSRNAKKIIVAAPIVPIDLLSRLRKEADEVVTILTPENFWGLSAFYGHFAQTTDETVINLMKKAK